MTVTWTAFVVGIAFGIFLGVFAVVGLYLLSTRKQRLPPSFTVDVPTARQLRRWKRERLASVVSRAS